MNTVNPEEPRNTTFLKKFKCRVCEKWKGNECFSNNELNGYRQKKLTGFPGLNGTTARLRCRLCTGSQINEIQCRGHCGIVRPYTEFSRTARKKNGGSMTCKECIAWREAQEPGVTTSAALTTDRATDEDEYDPTFTPNEIAYDSDSDGSAYSDPEVAGGADDDFENHTAISEWAPGTAASTTDDNVSTIGLGRNTFVSVPVEDFSRGVGSMSLSGPSANNSRSLGGASNAMSKVSSVGVPPTSLQSLPPRPPNTYFGWDNTGRAHVQRIPSDTTSQASSTITAAPVTNTSSKTQWAKPTGPRIAPRIPPPIAVTSRRGRRIGHDDDDDNSD